MGDENSHRMVNQLTSMFEKYPHLRDEKNEGIILEVLLEDELNGDEVAMRLNTKFARENIIKTKKGREFLKEIDEVK